MRKWAALIVFFCVDASAAARPTIFNSCTGCQDFVGSTISTTSIKAGSGVTVSSTSAGVQITATGSGTVLSTSSTNYIQNTSTLQSGATFFVSSGTVSNRLGAGFLGLGPNNTSTAYGIDARFISGVSPQQTAYIQDTTPVSGKTGVVIRAGIADADGVDADRLLEIQKYDGTPVMWARPDGVLVAKSLTAADAPTYTWILWDNTVHATILPGANFNNAGFVSWAATSHSYEAKDLALYRNAAGVLEVDNGTAGSLADMTLRSLNATTLTGSYANSVAVSTAALGTSTGTLRTDISALGVSTNTLLIKNTSALQTNATFYVSSGTVSGQFSPTTIRWPDGTVQVSSPSTATSPGGSSGQVQYNNAGSFAGSNLFQFNGSSPTFLSSVTIRTPTFDGGPDNIPPGYLNVYVGDTQAYDDRILMAVGSNQWVNQIQFNNMAPPYFGAFGITAGCLRTGYSGYEDQIGSCNSSLNNVNFWASTFSATNALTFQTGDVDGHHIMFFPQETLTMDMTKQSTTILSSATFVGTVKISSGLTLSGSAGTSGQVLTSAGPDTVPTWTTSSGGDPTVLANLGISTAALAVSTAALSTSTGALKSVDASLGASTFTLAQATGSLKTYIDSVAISTFSLGQSTATLAIATGTLQSTLGISTAALAASTGTLAASTGTLLNTLNNKVNLSSVTVATITWTGTALWNSPQTSTVTYGLRVGSITIAGPIFSTSVVQSATYTVTASTPQIILASATNQGQITITLPSVSGMLGKYVTIVKTDKSSSPVTVPTTSPDLIGGTTGNISLDAPGAFVNLFANSDGWWPLGKLPYTPDIIHVNDAGASASSVATASSTIFVSFSVPDPVCISSGVFVSSAIADNNIKARMGLYTSTGTTFSNMGLQLIAKTSTITITAPGMAGGTFTLDSNGNTLTKPACLPPGIYFAGLEANAVAWNFVATSTGSYRVGNYRVNTTVGGGDIPTQPGTLGPITKNPGGTPVMYLIPYRSPVNF